MGILKDKVSLSVKVNGKDLVDSFKNNSLYFYEKYQKSDKLVQSIPVGKIQIGGFYHFTYSDESNWMKYAPIYIASYKKFGNDIAVLAINLNFIPLEIRVLVFDKFIIEEDFNKDRLLPIDYNIAYETLRSFGFEYALMEFDAKRIVYSHKISMEVLPRFLYAQHPINKYDPKKLMEIWSAKLSDRDARDKEIKMMNLQEIFDIEKDLGDKYTILSDHINRLRRNNENYRF